jgi:purine-binding chemotaxis protein CheW
MSAARIDWDEARRQLARGAAALEGLDCAAPEDQARLLRERAAALAAPASRARDDSADSVEVLVFEAAGERYAFETAWVVRATPMPPLTAIPGLPAFIVGVVPFEGEVLAVLDLRSLLALPLAALADPTALVVLAGEGREFAVLAESIVGVRRYPRTALEHFLPAQGRARAWLQGVAADRTALLDARRLLTDSTLVVQADRQ